MASNPSYDGRENGGSFNRSNTTFQPNNSKIMKFGAYVTGKSPPATYADVKDEIVLHFKK
jgi:hypothetical protein